MDIRNVKFKMSTLENMDTGKVSIKLDMWGTDTRGKDMHIAIYFGQEDAQGLQEAVTYCLSLAASAPN